MNVVEYHLRELDIAKDPQHKSFALPRLKNSDHNILDLGCGIGQSFVALKCLERNCIGVDVSQDAIDYGRKLYGESITFYCCDASDIPVDSGTVDLVIARVSLPYTNIPKVIKEVERVLTPGGRFWLTLHSRKMVSDSLSAAFSKRQFRDFVHGIYVLLNGYCFQLTGRTFAYINGSFESWQRLNTMSTMLQKRGFSVQTQEYAKVTAIEATYGASLD